MGQPGRPKGSKNKVQKPKKPRKPRSEYGSVIKAQLAKMDPKDRPKPNPPQDTSVIKEKLDRCVRWQHHPVPEEEAMALASDLMHWSATEDAIVFEEWLGKHFLHHELAAHIARTHTCFRAAKKIAMQMIGSRRERLALQGKITDGIVKKLAPLYNPSAANWELKLRGMDQHAVNRALHVICRGVDSGKALEDVTGEALDGED